ncbi:hypothetical protein P153DRAFT_336743 [Dothidotthia symphoricarpi CBS 119687]|uniref:WDR59/RTC1-like RING zinc finger domain-containing protein n=1 Tax=Dothidotthia symphoricarpi CBS 119687 TaxID=1392245 RepID=A0A6A6AFZ6_9PLEO|nr:uncharacterized protein P153DRAFT_336743 [Dothidotthia symphoricarpi CBS 119687]KAF2130829.1 hypothetical protein P153DRAFT_336743 [Dothidotthia symphoricarpi CBS 119687]
MVTTAGRTPFESPTFDQNVSIAVDDDIGAASISPSGRDVVLASKSGLRIIDLDSPYSMPLFIPNQSSWDVADVQWSPFACRAEWIASTRNQLALVYNLSMPFNSKKAPIEYTLRAHDRAITDINFSAHHPELLATCGVDSFVFVHDLRSTRAPLKLADFTAGATQVKWNRQNDKIIASAHDKYLHIWDIRRGATPLATIAAHSTKIYGIDWNRSDPRKIMTCSLDSTIKLWSNVGLIANTNKPRRVIRTHYPVWRARHTPFPHGIFAMPQRGNSSLWLYKHVTDSPAASFTKDPVHEFRAHDPNAQVREFLWRSRGPTDNNIDDRDFQLVSWGTDKHLHLHRITPDLLEKSVGFRKGEPLTEEPSTTRMGAAYVTYRDGPVPLDATTRDKHEPIRHQLRGNLSTLLQNHSHVDEMYTSRWRSQAQPAGHLETLPRETMTATPIRRNNPRVVTHITWMDGVKFGDRHDDHIDDFHVRPEHDDRKDKYPYQEQNDLGAEISFVGNKYKKLTFEVIDVPGRRITVAFNGPWGDIDPATEDHKLVFLRFTITFPAQYPKIVETVQPGIGTARTRTPLDIEFERTTAAISKDKQEELMDDLDIIAEACAGQQREALEAVLSYALGERGLQDSLQLTDEIQLPEDIGPLPVGESSSDDDENEGEFTDDVMQSSHTNANVPLAIQCSVRFSAHGPLVVARIPSKKPMPLFDASPFRITRSLRHGPSKDDIFNSFGHFATHRVDDSNKASSPTSSNASWEQSTSSSSSSGSDHAADTHIGNFQPPLAWQKTASRLQGRGSVPSSIGAGRPTPKTKSIVSILSSAIDDFVPTKRVLAEEYRIFGPGPEVCGHNSDVAKKYGYKDLADIWMLCKLVLCNEVPLEILPQPHRKDQVLVLARRALVRIKRKDSGLDLQFDEADNVTNPKFTGRIKWGNHAVVTWLIPALFDHFERLADTQMLAMLSCIFAEPAAREGITSAKARIRQSQLPMSMEAPAFSLDYFSSADAAWSLFKPAASSPSTPMHSRHATPNHEFGWQGLVKSLDTYGSHNSSNGPWGSDGQPSGPVTPYSIDNTPPMLSRASTTRSSHTVGHTPYSTSPEQSHIALKRSSTANFANAVAALSRPFANAMSSSPPVRPRTDTGDLSTSAPTSVVTWGRTTFYGGGSQDKANLATPRSRHDKRASFGQSDQINVDNIYDSDSEYDQNNDDPNLSFNGLSNYPDPLASRDRDGVDGVEKIGITLKNQDQFDDEACVSKPLLNMSKDWLYRAWREQYADILGSWGLISARAEILKFNGLVSYFPPAEHRARSKVGSMCLALDKGAEEDSEQGSSRHPSKTSTLLAPPSATPGQWKRSPVASPRHFSFNPEATEFQPGTPSLMPTDETTIGNFMTPEQYLRLSIPAPTPTNEREENITRLGAYPVQTRLLYPHNKAASRPSLSRDTSNISVPSIWGGALSPPQNKASTTTKTASQEPIYSCSICWIRVKGRFYLCPACGHVAHFNCMDDELEIGEDECVVGCGCGCGLEDDDERSRMEVYIEGVRAANAAGVAWQEGSGWQMVEHTMNEHVKPELMESETSARGRMDKDSNAQERKRRERLNGRSVANTSPGSSTKAKRKEKGKEKKKVKVSGLSYY